uniref:Uncharacterized protein n=2 Tax=Paramoeba aestuarina TaxID=180227 RepID=A0A7S4JMY9_9EUKA|mmetsp:Transcript_11847/g.17981  ORF Transcript_11847/g.17981 Transcript_11847/m.17981 type:complete len:280 (+) Transcript_11847:84-923(+)
MFSVATLHSKFGIPITSITAEEVADLPWINCLMLHTGSHGCGLDLLVDGVAKVVDFATKVNEISKKKRGAAQIRTFDIGGGVPAILSTENEICKFREYAQSLKERCPELFSGQFSKIVTEFGASMFARTGWVASRVEYTKEIIDEDQRRRTLVIIHAGADLFLRKCYAGTGCHPLSLHSSKGELLPVVELGEKHSLFGPLCFSGDELSEKNGSVEFARQAVPGDIVVVHNAGANVISLFNHHCSRNASQVIIFRSNEGDITLNSVRSEDSVQGTVAFWG